MVLSQQLDSALKCRDVTGTLGKAWGIGLITIAQAANSVCAAGIVVSSCVSGVPEACEVRQACLPGYVIFLVRWG